MAEIGQQQLEKIKGDTLFPVEAVHPLKTITEV
jgi:hypothetical protein